ncbi:MAG TPA: amidohydrolase family protein [Thermodesulfovibrionales bacterium]|nr:amidohydrolase family protein [Thermodesulfovibrionales bacterium]
MNGIVDFHTHAFPDALAERAVKTLEEEGGIKAHLDGSVSSLLLSMDKHAIEKSVVCSIATKPSQFNPILRWCKEIQSERIIPFPSFHPGDPGFRERIIEIKGEGFKGIKFHPYYQDFALNEEGLFPVYEEICRANLVMVVHTGFDIAFARIPKADPLKIVEVKKRFPELKLVTTHLGSWEQWKEVEELLMGKPIFMEISCSLESLDKNRAKEIILNHPGDYVLFGTDSPWTGQGETLSLLQSLDLGAEMESRILRENAINLLNSV